MLIRILSFFLLALAGISCSKSSGPSSPAGNWKYTTDDGKVTVTFTLVSTSNGGLDIQNPVFIKDGISYNAAATIAGVKLPAIGEIRINTNDVKLTYPYVIDFLGGSVSSDFNRITVSTGTYTYPNYTDTKSFSNATIVRP